MSTQFYAPQEPLHLRRERLRAQKLKDSSWWQQQLSRGVCYYCGKRYVEGDLTMDHRVPLARGGVSSRSNIVCCCKSCNTQKGVRTAAEFALDMGVSRDAGR